MIRRSQLECLEPRRMFTAAPIWVGGVYVEEDTGSDAHGDSFYITFQGGAAGTQLKRLVLNTDQGQPGYSVADNFFDTVEGGRGADHGFPFRIESLNAASSAARVRAEVSDGGMQLVLLFENFYAGDRLHFSIDVDEVQHLYSLDDLDEFNEGIDPITSGAEFEGSRLTAYFSAPRFEDASTEGRFVNRYDPLLAPSGLNLPADNANGMRDRTAGTAASVTQIPKPIALSGIVYVDNNLNLRRESGERGIAGVELELLRRDGNQYRSTGYQTVTDSNGRYEFGMDLGLMPGTYQIRQSQPAGYYSVGATPGRLNGASGLGTTVSDDPNVLTEIAILDGDSRGIELNFAEAQPTQISGFVYRDNNNDGVRQEHELGLGDVEIRILSIQTLTGEAIDRTVRTDPQGSYSFLALPPGTYRILEVQPEGFFDGLETVGKVGSETRGVSLVNDEITTIRLDGNDEGVEYNFAEIDPASLSGHVCIALPGYSCFSNDPSGSLPVAGVTLELLNGNGELIATTMTAVDGSYLFDQLMPGTYTIREYQPIGLFDGASRAGTIGGATKGQATSGTQIEGIEVFGGDAGIQFDFCEIQPAAISGYVFQDGEELVTETGLPPDDLRGIRNGVRTPDDRPLAGVLLELRRVDGTPATLDDALPGTVTDEVIRVQTDELGFFEFTGLRPGRYHVYQVQQPVDLFDGLDTAGSTGGYADNPYDSDIDPIIESLLESLRQDPSTHPNYDAILMIEAVSGQVSVENNFSEVAVRIKDIFTPPPPVPEPPTPEPPTPEVPGIGAPPPERLAPPMSRIPDSGTVPPPLPPLLVLAPNPELPYVPPLAGYAVDYTWHLSIINAGEPRGYQGRHTVDRDTIANASRLLNVTHWTIDSLNYGQWYIASNQVSTSSKNAFNVRGAKQLAGDFNGDGRDELALYKDGEWLLDMNGNGVWDRGDMWIRLGSRGDLPVVGDWDGDGKDDIGIFGPTWEGDYDRIEDEPGLPDPQNRWVSRPKNIPVHRRPEPASDTDPDFQRVRLMQRSSRGEGRSDAIDHVFRFGGSGDQPVAGDFSGSGLSKIGVFRDGKWKIDMDGDGRFDSLQDAIFEFGQAGDIAIVGDFNGDGLDEVAVVRGNQVMVDSNGNGRLDATDRVFQIEGDGDGVVVGDFDGDGIDEAVFYSIESDGDTGIRQARAG